jgi:hypothetical protein
MTESIEKSWTEVLQEFSSEKLYINAYFVTRHYGGPEEGGWYWNQFEPISSILFDKGYWDGDYDTIPTNLLWMAKQARKKIMQELYHHKTGDIYSSRGGLDIEVVFENHVAYRHPQTRPSYC